MIRHFLPSLLIFLAALLLPLPASAKWLPREVGSVRAFAYDYTQEPGNDSLFKKGHIHKGVINDGGALLNEDQTNRLRAALKSTEPRISGAFCYEPHHGFIFYDKKGVPMGHIELCFGCGNVASSPAGLPEVEWDWKAISAILDELKIPFAKVDKPVDSNAAYTKMYLEAHPNAAKAPEPAPAEPDGKKEKKEKRKKK